MIPVVSDSSNSLTNSLLPYNREGKRKRDERVDKTGREEISSLMLLAKTAELRSKENESGHYEDVPKKVETSYVYANGDKYEGQWLNGFRHGNGIVTYPNGDKYEGLWSNDVAHGKGKSVYADGYKCIGEWRNNVPYGKITHISPQGDRLDVHPSKAFAKGLQDVSEPEITENSDKYEGQQLKGFRHGQGTCIYANGDKYEGQWVNGFRHGNGIVTYPNGDKYEGLWSNDVAHGKGKSVCADGYTCIGEWRNNVPYGKITHISPEKKRMEVWQTPPP